MKNIQIIESADLVVISSNEITTYLSVGSFYDTNDGVFYYLEGFENAKNKGDYLSKLNYCEFIYLLFYWEDNNADEYEYLSKKSADILKSYRELDSPELSSDFFEFHWYNSYCQFENIVWHADFAWGIGDNGDVFLLNTDWDDHKLYVRQNLFNDLSVNLEQIKKEIIENLQ
jgi:hypothetical protein